MTDFKDILFEIQDQVAWLTINRTQALNAFREQTLDEIIGALRSVREDPSIICVGITGADQRA